MAGPPHQNTASSDSSKEPPSPTQGARQLGCLGTLPLPVEDACAAKSSPGSKRGEEGRQPFSSHSHSLSVSAWSQVWRWWIGLFILDHSDPSPSMKLPASRTSPVTTFCRFSGCVLLGAVRVFPSRCRYLVVSGVSFLVGRRKGLLSSFWCLMRIRRCRLSRDVPSFKGGSKGGALEWLSHPLLNV